MDRDVEVKSRKELRDWLRKNHKQKESIWLVTYKKGSEFWLPYDDIVEEVLCFGWIDSLPRKLDEARTKLRLSPRKPKSGWSAVNKVRIEKLIKNKLMTLAGLEKITAAKKDGSWTKLDQGDKGILSPELEKAFSKNKLARKNFEAFPPSAKKGILEWVNSAKTDETRNKRITETVKLAAKNLRANQWRPKK